MFQLHAITFICLWVYWWNFISTVSLVEYGSREPTLINHTSWRNLYLLLKDVTLFDALSPPLITCHCWIGARQLRHRTAGPQNWGQVDWNETFVKHQKQWKKVRKSKKQSLGWYLFRTPPDLCNKLVALTALQSSFLNQISCFHPNRYWWEFKDLNSHLH